MLMTAFWVSGAVTAGIFGRLGDMFGKRLIILLLVGLFSLGALVCAVAPTLLVMIGGRVLMGCGVGLFPLAYALIRDAFPPRRVPGSIALLAGLVAGGAAVGQSIGGLVADHLGFRSIFWVALALRADLARDARRVRARVAGAHGRQGRRLGRGALRRRDRSAADRGRRGARAGAGAPRARSPCSRSASSSSRSSCGSSSGPASR